MALAKMPTIPSDERYRGYWIKRGFAGLQWFVQKDGFTVGEAETVEAGKRIVDAIHGD